MDELDREALPLLEARTKALPPYERKAVQIFNRWPDMARLTDEEFAAGVENFRKNCVSK